MAPFPFDESDTPWAQIAQMYPAAGQVTTQATVNSAPLEPFDACRWVSPSVAADLGQIFETHRYLGEYDTLLVSSVATNTAITASSSRQQDFKKTRHQTSTQPINLRLRSSSTQSPISQLSHQLFGIKAVLMISTVPYLRHT